MAIRQASCVTNTAHACAARFVTVTSDRQIDTTDRQSDFPYRCSFFHTVKNTRLDKHTQTHSATAVSLNVASTSGILLNSPAFQRTTLFSRGLFKAFCFPTVSPTTQASPELRTFLPILQLSCFPISRTTGKSKFHCLSLGLYNIRIQSSVFPSINRCYSIHSSRSCLIRSAHKSRLAVKRRSDPTRN